MEKANCTKSVIEVGNVSKGHQWGITVARGGCYPTEVAGQYKSPIKVVRKWVKN